MSNPVELLEELEAKAPQELADCKDPGQLEDFRLKYLSRSGKLREILSSMGEVPEEKRPEVGRRANQLKQQLTEEFEAKKEQLEKEAQARKTREKWLDVTLPGRAPSRGSKHPVNLAMNEIETIFTRMGFESVGGPEIETEWYNFDALNTPEEHPARDMHDTFYLEDGRLLRTHTSPVQIHVMENEKPPLQIIAPGRVFRRDADVTHSPVFHQVEGLWVDKEVTFADLKGSLELFVQRFFGPETDQRFRPSYFPFTEPSAEIDIAFEETAGEKEWLEILGGGMVDPEVFKAVGYDPDKWQGYAFGMGVERMAMLKYGIDNLQLFFQNEQKFLEQFLI